MQVLYQPERFSSFRSFTIISQSALPAGVSDAWRTGKEENNFVCHSILDRFVYHYTLATGAIEDYFYYQNPMTLLYFLIVKYLWQHIF